jgi:hypothetical protein
LLYILKEIVSTFAEYGQKTHEVIEKDIKKKTESFVYAFVTLSAAEGDSRRIDASVLRALCEIRKELNEREE